ncbi:MAG: hypothetical protein ACREIC_00590, partial [Limisphaerales bacterium]
TKESDVIKPIDAIEFGDSSVFRSDFNIGPLTTANCGGTFLSDGIYDLSLRQPGSGAPLSNGATSAELNSRRARNQRRHSGRWNIIFCDGHVEYKAPSQFFDVFRRPELARRWNVDNQPHLDDVDPGLSW